MTPASPLRVSASSLISLLAVIILSLGLVAAVGWMLGSPMMVRMVPGSVAMGLNTALGLIAGGIWLLIRQAEAPAARRVRISLAVFIVVLFALILIQHIFGIDLGIDLRELHRRIPDRNPRPGRVAPNTSLALFICGCALLLRDFNFKLASPLVRILGLCVLAIGLSGLMGYVLDLEWLYTWYRLNSMAVPTAVAITLLGTAITLETYRPRRFRVRDADKRIVARAIATLSLLATTFMLSGFVVMRDGLEQSIRDNMLQLVEDNRALLLNIFEQHARTVRLVETSPSLAYSIETAQGVRAGLIDTPALSELAETRQRFLLLGFSRFDVHGPGGAMLAGEPHVPQALMRLKLNAAGPAAELIWRDGYLLSNRITLKDGNETLATVLLEQPLRALLPSLARSLAPGTSGEHRLCARLEQRLRCFPSRLGGAPLDLPLLERGQPSLPVARAILHGETGVTTATDHRGKAVLAAYVPIEPGTLGLGFSQAIEEVFAPLRERLALLIGLVVMLVAVSVLILRSAVRPLATQLLRAETTAREQAAALRASMHALNEASTELRDSERQVRALNSDLERRVAERTADLTRANDELRQFAYAASHDLQEPLRNIGLFSQFVQRRYADKLDQQGVEYLDLIAQNARRMQQLLRDVLEYTQAGEALEGNPITDPNAALDEALANLQSAMIESGARIERGELPAKVGVHHTHMVQILQNLISNAIKYRASAAPRIQIEARREDKAWLFSVRDNGIGIEFQYLEHIFGVFRRLHKSEYPGTGMGLAICLKIVQRYDGSIWAESAPGEGTTFYFSLPAATGE